MRRTAAPLFRASDEEQRAQVDAVRAFQARHARGGARGAARLQAVAAGGGNVFAELLETVQVCSLGPDHARALRSRRPVPPAHVGRLAVGAGRLAARSGSPSCRGSPRATVAQLQRRIVVAAAAGGRRRSARRNALRASRPRQDARRRHVAPGAEDHRRHHRAGGARRDRERAGVEFPEAHFGRERALGKEHQRMAAGRGAQYPARIGAALVAIEALDEFRADAAQQQARRADTSFISRLITKPKRGGSAAAMTTPSR